MLNLEHRVQLLETAFLNERNAHPGPRLAAKYAEAAVDHLLTKHGCATVADLDKLITELTAIALQHTTHGMVATRGPV